MPPRRSKSASEDETGRRDDLFQRYEISSMAEDRKIQRATVPCRKLDRGGSGSTDQRAAALLVAKRGFLHVARRG
jgi:hypothetical protein